MKKAEWYIDVYDFHNSTSPVRKTLEEVGMPFEFHDLTLEPSAQAAVAAMRTIDGIEKSPRVYIRKGVHPRLDLHAMLVDPSKAVLKAKLRYHEIIP